MLDGTKTITVIGLAGQMLSRTAYAVPQTTILSLETNSNFDEVFRPGRVTYLDGTYKLITYDCCGVSSVTERDGTRTDYAYDDLKRLLTETRNSIVTSYTYDGAGRRLTTTRQGTNGASIFVNRSGYDLAGRLITSTNALNNVTTYSETSVTNQVIRTTVFPDLSTETRVFARDGSLLEASGTAVAPKKYLYGVTNDSGNKVYSAEVRVSATGGTNEFVKTVSDSLGRPFRTVFPAAAQPVPSELSIYSNRGFLTNRFDADGVSNIYTFNAKAEPVYSVVDSNRNGTIDFSGGDRVTYTTNDVVVDNGTNVMRTRVYVWNTSANSSNLVSTTETSTDGLQSWNTIWNSGVAITSRSQTFYDAAHGLKGVTNTAPDSSFTVTTNQYGRLISVTRRDANGVQLSQTVYSYDPHGRQNTMTDARNGTTTIYFDDLDRVTGMTTPAPGNGGSAQVTTNYFDNMGRVWKSTLPDGTSVTNEFFTTGLLKKKYGSRLYPVEYTYDAQGRMLTMKTWKNFSANSGTATTTWAYDQYRGWLTGKTYDGGAAGPSYTYTAAGRLASRLWARGTNTTCLYNFAGDLSTTFYSDTATSGITNAFDRRGRVIGVTNGASICTFNLGDPGQLLSEKWSAGPLNGLTVSNVFDATLRRTTNGVWNGTVWLTQARYAYDAGSRLSSVGDGTNSASYSYVANSPLVSQIAFTNISTRRMLTAKGYDFLNRLTNITSTAGAATVASFNYQYNTADQRTSVTNADGTYIVYSYDSLGQVTAGNKYWSDGTPVAGQQFNYAFDDIGNRKTAAVGGDVNGVNLRSATYGANSLNQYTNRTVPGYVNVIGSANSNATVSLWTDNGAYAPTLRKGTYFRGELSIDNTTNSLWLMVTNVAVLTNGSSPDIVTNTIGNAFLAQTAELFYYDLDGNLTVGGRWTNSWNSENRLIGMVCLTNAASGSKRRLTFGYDYQGRRMSKQVETWTGSAWSVTLSNKFLYDGWKLIAELNGTNNAVIRSYMWGIDLSGSQQGAGGVGGLLAENDAAQGVHFVAFDGNGNVADLAKANDGTVSANYEYGPFGEVVKSSGAMAKGNPIRFSTKYQDDETDLVYYGYRYYNSSMGRWVSCDPVSERGGLNLCGFIGNDGLNELDNFGLWGTKLRQWVCRKLGVKKDVSTMIGVGANSALNSGEIDVSGELLQKVEQDPTVVSLNDQIEQKVIDSIRATPSLLDQCSPFSFSGAADLMFGGNTSEDPKWDQLKYTLKHPIGTFDKYGDTWSVAANPLTWLFRHAPATYVVDGTICNCCGSRCATYTVNYRVTDTLDLRPHNGNHHWNMDMHNPYDVATSILGVGYHDILGATDNLSVRAAWQKSFTICDW